MYFDETIGCATSSIDQLRDGRYLYAITKAAAIECPYGVFSSKFWSRRFERVKEYIPGLQDSLPFVCGLVGYSFQGERERERESVIWNNRHAIYAVCVWIHPFPLEQNNYTADSFLYVPPLGITDQELKYFDFPQVIARTIRVRIHTYFSSEFLGSALPLVT